VGVVSKIDVKQMTVAESLLECRFIRTDLKQHFVTSADHNELSSTLRTAQNSSGYSDSVTSGYNSGTSTALHASPSGSSYSSISATRGYNSGQTTAPPSASSSSGYSAGLASSYNSGSTAYSAGSYPYIDSSRAGVSGSHNIPVGGSDGMRSGATIPAHSGQ
jgi:hypothetical protein